VPGLPRLAIFNPSTTTNISLPSEIALTLGFFGMVCRPPDEYAQHHITRWRGGSPLYKGRLTLLQTLAQPISSSPVILDSMQLLADEVIE
jgi:hypothetical protein